MGLNLAHGGHLTHGHPLNFSGKMYKIIPYGVRKDTETIDYVFGHRTSLGPAVGLIESHRVWKKQFAIVRQ